MINTLKNFGESFYKVITLKKRVLRVSDMGLVNDGYHPFNFEHEMVMLNHMRKYGKVKVEQTYARFYYEKYKEIFNNKTLNFINTIKRVYYNFKLGGLKSVILSKSDSIKKRINQDLYVPIRCDVKTSNYVNVCEDIKTVRKPTIFPSSILRVEKDRQLLLAIDRRLRNGETIPPPKIYKSYSELETEKVDVSDSEYEVLKDRIYSDSIDNTKLPQEVKVLLKTNDLVTK